MQSPHPIRLTLSQPRSWQTLSYQVLDIELTTKDRMVSPHDLGGLELPPGIDTRGGVVISGRAPIWLYAYLVHELHPTAWVACYDPRLGAVVVATHSRQAQIGQVFPMDPGGKHRPRLCPAVMVVGPPDSGKSVFSHALFTTLLPTHPDIYLQRAHWDGEGNWILELDETATDADREAYKLANKGGLTDRFFPHHAQAILNLRRQKQLVIVDVGGKVQTEKVPLLEACSHYIVISSKSQEIAPWHEFCGDRGNLKCLAVIHSSLEPCETIHKREPWLEITCGPWVQGNSCAVPSVLLEHLTGTLLGTTR
ncbi:MAG TPA: CRISPR-associated protein Csx3 [Synechococcales cyanobacterium M55_K2018_004]|nr:CRISPR-associated protein Csx3 [Synechococcales cyanobacterium M55_K2018_004]